MTDLLSGAVQLLRRFSAASEGRILDAELPDDANTRLYLNQLTDANYLLATISLPRQREGDDGRPIVYASKPIDGPLPYPLNQMNVRYTRTVRSAAHQITDKGRLYLAQLDEAEMLEQFNDAADKMLNTDAQQPTHAYTPEKTKSDLPERSQRPRKLTIAAEVATIAGPIIAVITFIITILFL